MVNYIKNKKYKKRSIKPYNMVKSQHLRVLKSNYRWQQ